MEKEYIALVSGSFGIKGIENGFSFRAKDGMPCELTITPHMEIHKGKVILTANYDLKVNGYFYTYGSSHGKSGEAELETFGKLYMILQSRYNAQIEKEKKAMYEYVESLNK